MTPERFLRLRQALERRQPDLTVLLENVHKPHNFAAILRTADAVGLFEAHAVFGERSLRTSLVSAGGVDRWVEVEVHQTVAQALEHLSGRGFRLMAAHPGEAAIDYREFDWTKPAALILGQEKDGLTEATLAAADELVSIPMMGMGQSLNVSVAAALVLFEAQRQRAEAGLYQSPRLAPEDHCRTLFEWAYPKIAELCRRRGLSYPRLSDRGEILDQVPR